MTERQNGTRPQHFRRVAAQFATGVSVVTSATDDVPLGMTVNSFATVSLEPTLLLVCLGRGARLLSTVEQSGVFAVTVLAADQLRLAKWFANRARPTGAAAFAGIPVRHAPTTGCLLLAEGLAYFDCRVRDLFPGGDHTIVVGEVAACDELWPRPPLVFAGGEFLTTDPRPRLGHWAAPVDVATVAASDGASSGSGASTAATAWAVTTRT
jgi:flavin reductase (DIM6/NTAB) family NADH-FMN oxidoreductase RutF